jgi:Zn finger protein HypA/HybF involved in hydrogenase expression
VSGAYEKRRKPEWMTNREERRKPKRGKFWCIKCDAQLVSEGARCPNCGNVNGRSRNKR